MEIITPYYTIFKENNWFFNSETKNIGYSDEDITITSVILNIPFRDDVHYNKRLLGCLDKFIKIQNQKNGLFKISYSFNENEKKPINTIFFYNGNSIQLTKSKSF